jgi:hypothetical protein
MNKVSRWINDNVRLASDTTDGALMKRRLEALVSDIKKLKHKAQDNGPNSVMSRFRTDVRRAIELLPPVVRVMNMNLWQIAELDVQVNRVKGMLERYRAKES